MGHLERFRLDSAMKAKLIRVRFEDVLGNRVMAVSDDLPGLMVAGGSTDEVRACLPQAIEELFEAAGQTVRVSELEVSQPRDANSFVAVPQAELACA
jgi:predicted RNase H-like HicB family nuclease